MIDWIVDTPNSNFINLIYCISEMCWLWIRTPWASRGNTSGPLVKTEESQPCREGTTFLANPCRVMKSPWQYWTPTALDILVMSPSHWLRWDFKIINFIVIKCTISPLSLLTSICQVGYSTPQASVTDLFSGKYLGIFQQQGRVAVNPSGVRLLHLVPVK